MQTKVSLIRNNYDGIADENSATWMLLETPAIPLPNDTIIFDDKTEYRVTRRQFSITTGTDNSEPEMEIRVVCVPAEEGQSSR